MRILRHGPEPYYIIRELLVVPPKAKLINFIGMVTLPGPFFLFFIKMADMPARGGGGVGVGPRLSLFWRRSSHTWFYNVSYVC